MDRTDLIAAARRAIRDAAFTTEPINNAPTVDLKGKAATDYVQANPLPNLNRRPFKKAAAVAEAVVPLDDDETEIINDLK